MNMNKKIIVFLQILLCSILSSCVKDEIPTTGSIVGVVKDYSTSETLQGCLVTLTPGGLSTSTGTDGRYEFSNISPETYSLEFSKDGYEAEKKSVVVNAGKMMSVDVMMKKKDSRLSLSSDLLNFGDLEVLKDLIITSENNMSIALKPNADWIKVTPSTGIASKTGLKVSVLVDRTGLTIGDYSSSIVITSQLGIQEVPVQMSISPSSSPEVKIVSGFYEISETSFKIDGFIVATGGSQITSYGHCWSEKNNPTIEDMKTNLGSTKEVGKYTSMVSNLTRGNTYYVRAYAINKNGVGYSDVISITMPLIKAPTVETESATDISENHATLNGRIVDNGGGDVTECGFYWGESKDTPYKLKLSATENSFNSTISSLKEGTIYYFKAYAVNSKGESIGDVLSFKTNKSGGQDEPYVTTMEAKNITYNSATLVGSVTTNGVDIIEYGFLVGENPYQVKTYKVGSSNVNGTYTMDLNYLERGKKYVYAAYVITSDDELIVGDYVSFQTVPPTNAKISRIKYSCRGSREHPNSRKILTYDLYAEVDLQGHTIKDCGFLFGYSYSAEERMDLHYKYDTMDIFQCTPSNNTFSLKTTRSEIDALSGSAYVRAYVVLDNNEEIYSETKYLYDGANYDITY